MSHPTTGQESQVKHATVNGLAIVGFVALIGGGIFLAIAAAGFVPETLSRLAGAVYLFDTTATSTATTTDETTPDETPVVPEPKPATPVATPATTTPEVKKPVTGGPLLVPSTPRVVYNRPQLFGLPDLTVEILEVGYLRSSSPSSFRESSRVPEGERPAIRYRVKNIGTNQTASTWETEVEYPSESGDDTYTITSRGALNPNGYKDFTFGFDNPDTGSDREFTVTVDSDDDMNEANERNNTDRAEVDIDD